MSIYLEDLQSILNRPHLLEKAKECGFCCRQRSINTSSFFEVLLYCATREQCCSLSFLSSRLQIDHGIEVSKTAVDKRFNEKCVKFIESVLGEILQDRYRDYLCVYGDRIFANYNRVRVKDSTKFQLPKAMKDNFSGTGGSGSPSAVSIQFEYDIKRGEVLHWSIGNGSDNDHKDASETAYLIEEGDLVIRDLGYFSREVFSIFDKQGGFFLSRLDSQIKVVIDKGRRVLNFKDLYAEMTANGVTRKEIKVLIGGGKNALKVRLMVELVPDNIYEQRIRNRRKQHRRNPRHKHLKSDNKTAPVIKEETKARYHFTLLISNADAKLLPISFAFPLYHIRWQIELIFKSFKGTFYIDKVHKMKKERFLTFLLAKLLLIVINLQVIYQVQIGITREAHRAFSEKHRKKKRKPNMTMQDIPIISHNKAFKTLHGIYDFFRDLFFGDDIARFTAERIQRILSRNHRLEKKKNKLNFYEILNLFSCKSKD